VAQPPRNALPQFALREEESFRQDRLALVASGMTEPEIDEHVRAMEFAILPDPYAAPWSQPLPDDPGRRHAVSDPTPAEPNGLVAVFSVDGEFIAWERLSRRP